MSTYIELINGKIVTRDAEEWRDECLARWVLQYGRGDADNGLARRRRWLADYEDRHGKAAADKLKAGILELTKPVDKLNCADAQTPESPQ